MSLLTYKMIVKDLINNYTSDEIITWALELLDQNITSDLIFEIAGLDKPLNYFESESYRVKLLEELKLNSFTDSEKELLKYQYYLNRLLKECNKIALAELSSYTGDDHKKDIFVFSLLSWAWGELSYQSYSDYWPEATQNNIKELVIEESKNWLIHNSVDLKDKEKYFR